MSSIYPINASPKPVAETAPLARLLIVDDNVRLAESLKYLVEIHGYVAHVCNSGFAALDLVAEQRFDLMLLDLSMPGMTGHEVLMQLPKGKQRIPVVVISGTKTLNAAIDAMRHGAYDFLRKPYQPEELLRTIENALEHSRLELQNKSIHARLEESETLYQYLIDSSPDIIYTLDDNGNFTFINNRVETLLGYSRETMLGKHYTLLIHEEDYERAHHAFNERRTGNRAEDGQPGDQQLAVPDREDRRAHVKQRLVGCDDSNRCGFDARGCGNRLGHGRQRRWGSGLFVADLRFGSGWWCLGKVGRAQDRGTRARGLGRSLRRLVASPARQAAYPVPVELAHQRSRHPPAECSEGRRILEILS